MSPPAAHTSAPRHDGGATVDKAWSDLRRHLLWADPPWLVFVFADGSAQSRELARRASEDAQSRDAAIDVRRPSGPEALRHEADALLAGPPIEGCVWIDAVRGSSASDEDPWREAWIWLIRRLNERRDFLLRRAAGGLVLAIPVDLKPAVRDRAPDLWTIRSLAVELRAHPVPKAAGAFVWLSAPGPAAPAPAPGAGATRRATVPNLALALAEEERLRRLIAKGEGSEARSLPEARGDGWDPREALLAQRRLASAELDAAVALREHYRLDEALARAQSAVDRLRSFSEGESASHADDRVEGRGLGRALAVQSEILGRMGRIEEALVCNEEAAERLRAALQRHPETARVLLIETLLGRSASLRGANRLDEALDSAREAVALGAQWSGRGPVVERTLRASSLANLGAILRERDEVAEARPVLLEAIALWRELAANGVGTARARLPSSLGNLASVLARLEEPGASLDAIREAVDWLRVLSDENPDAFGPDLAVSLTHLAVRLRELGRVEDAAEAAREAAALRRALAAHQPETFESGLALSLTALARAELDQGEVEAARGHSQEAVELLWPYFERDPLAYAPWMRQVAADAQTVFSDDEPEWLLDTQSELEATMASLRATTGS